jgi:metal-dependent amidase/aminoacylase/carboxypeptidase family protein
MGCKVAVVDGTGKVLDTTVVYPTHGERKKQEAIAALSRLVRKHGVSHIAIGNGTASRETEQMAVELIQEEKNNGIDLSYMIVSEAGASVYSASPLAAEEFPQYDVNLRSAVSIARRLQDPLAELVKIEPKAIGVGQYQHDMPEKQLDAALCWHPGDSFQTITGTNNSCIQVLYKFSGVPAHAAGDPYNGRSALDAVELMNVGVQFLREHMTGDCRIHYAITDAGGISPNVVQSTASVLYMVRANRVSDTVKLQARVDKIAEGAALMTETSFERVFIDGTADTLPNYTLEGLLYENFKEVGVPQYTPEEKAFAAALRKTYPHGVAVDGCGPRADETIREQARALSENYTKPLNDFLLPLYSGNVFTPGSTDVGDVSWLTPTAQINVVTWPAEVPGHSWQVVSCGKSSIARKGMLCASKVMAGTAIDLIDRPEALAAARAEWEKRAAEGYTCPIEPGAMPIAI